MSPQFVDFTHCDDTFSRHVDDHPEWTGFDVRDETGFFEPR